MLRRSPRTRGALAAACAFLLLSGCRAGLHPPGQPPEPVLLLTGFEPFGGRARNVSWDAIAPWDGTVLHGYRVRCVRLPVLWGETARPLADRFETLPPQAALCLGEGHPGRYSVEATARNVRRNLPDNAGRKPASSRVLEDGLDSYPSALPVDRIVSALREAGFPAERSENAGGYLCEECFYTLARLGRERLAGRPHGFLHVPPYPRVPDPTAPGGWREPTETEAARHAAEVRKALEVALQAMFARAP